MRNMSKRNTNSAGGSRQVVQFDRLHQKLIHNRLANRVSSACGIIYSQCMLVLMYPTSSSSAQIKKEKETVVIYAQANAPPRGSLGCSEYRRLQKVSRSLVCDIPWYIRIECFSNFFSLGAEKE